MGRPAKHGMSHTRIYNIWQKMNQRCHNPKSDRYEYYGARGIQVCEEWRSDFMAFYNWGIANGYSDNLSIDRIDVNGDYTPENCRWATAKTQAMNKRPYKTSETKITGIYLIQTYKAVISVNGKQISLGTYGSMEEAIEARKKAR